MNNNENLAEAKRNLIGPLSKFIAPQQKQVLGNLLRGEERTAFAGILNDLAERIAKMPHTCQTDGQGENAIVYLHYFGGGAMNWGAMNWWITEKDKDGGTQQAFGKADLGDGGELGYISIDEITAAHMEIDLYWTTKPLKECK